MYESFTWRGYWFVTHYPVTPAFWKGVWKPSVARQPLRRACDWRRNQDTRLYSFIDPECPDCVAYKSNLHRLFPYGLWRRPRTSL